MSATSGTTAHDKDSRRRKVRAILAGGLVLGLGAAVTLANWNDSEFAAATFTAGTFNLQGSTDGTTFTDHASVAGAAALTFTTPFSALSPTDVVVAPFAVRLAAGTTNNADLRVQALTVTESGGTANAANLTYAIYPVVSSAACTVAVAGTPLASGSLGTPALPAATTQALTKGASTAVPGATQWLCVKVTAGAALNQSTATVATWQLQAVSN